MASVKKIVLPFLLLLVSVSWAQQFLFVENFNGNTAYPPGNGDWLTKNNSVPTGNTWFYGRPNVFKALTGKDSSCYAVNFSSTGTSGYISNWLITPTLALVNGNVFGFFTRTTSTSIFADRLQVYLSTADTTTNVGNTSTSVGTFSTLLLDINPAYSQTLFPHDWTAFTITLGGLSGTETGRFAFRYFIEDGGLSGANGNYVAIDSVTYFGTAPVLKVNERGNYREKIHVFPNPTNDVLHVQGTEVAAIELYNPTGSRIANSRLNSNYSFSLAALPPGIYLLKIYNAAGDLLHQKKVIKE